MSADQARIGIKLTWHEGDLLTLPVRQVYGFLFEADGRLLLIELDGAYTLPGGKPEHGEELEQTLRRECLEEAQTEIDTLRVVGFQCVEGDHKFWDGTSYLQVRMTGRITRMRPPALDPATGREYERHLVDPRDAPQLLKWGESGLRQVQTAIRLASSAGITT